MNDRQLALAALLAGKEVEWQFKGAEFPEYWWPMRGENGLVSMAASHYLATGVQIEPGVNLRIKPEEAE